MKISLIINTAASDPNVALRRNPHRFKQYGAREEMVLETIRECQDFDEIIVAGVFEPKTAIVAESEFTYLFVPPTFGDRRDALMQREQGARLSTGDILVFTHDDHRPQNDFVHDLVYLTETIGDANGSVIPLEYDILIPKRVHGKTGEELNNGKAEGYMGGHTLVMKREAWVRLPWLAVQPHRCWDIPYTELIKERELKMVFTDDLISVDLEATEDEQ